MLDFITINHLIAYGITVIIAFAAMLYHDWKVQDITLSYAALLVVLAFFWPAIAALAIIVFGWIAIMDGWDALPNPVILKQKGTD